MFCTVPCRVQFLEIWPQRLKHHSFALLCCLKAKPCPLGSAFLFLFVSVFFYFPILHLGGRSNPNAVSSVIFKKIFHKLNLYMFLYLLVHLHHLLGWNELVEGCLSVKERLACDAQLASEWRVEFVVSCSGADAYLFVIGNMNSHDD